MSVWTPMLDVPIHVEILLAVIPVYAIEDFILDKMIIRVKVCILMCN